MKTSQDIINELKLICPILAENQQSKVYLVPERYFEQFPSMVINKLKSDVNSGFYFTSVNPYCVPENYFNGLAGQIFSNIHALEGKNEVQAELEDIAPLLNTINKNPVFTVRGDYFENISAEVNSPKAKIVKMSFPKKLTRYAMAAAVTSIMALGVYFFNTNRPVEPTMSFNTVEKVNSLSEKDIMQYMQTYLPHDPVTSSNTYTIKREAEISETVKEMTDKEIQQYLMAIGENVEI